MAHVPLTIPKPIAQSLRYLANNENEPRASLLDSIPPTPPMHAFCTLLTLPGPCCHVFNNQYGLDPMPNCNSSSTKCNSSMFHIEDNATRPWHIVITPSLSKPIRIATGEVVSLKIQIQTSGMSASSACKIQSSKECKSKSRATLAPLTSSRRILPRSNGRKASGRRNPSIALRIHCWPLDESSRGSTAYNRGHE